MVEVMVALVIMGVVATLAAQAFNTASSSAAATREAMERLAKIDRTFFLIEQDLRNVVPKFVRPEFGEALPPLFAAARGEDYWLTVMRGGFANPLHQPRTEEVRVGYRYIDEEIWRDVWYDPRANDQEESRQQKLLTDVADMTLRILSSSATSLAAGPWLQNWPQGGSDAIPLALEVTLNLEDMGEVTRLFSLLPGQGEQIIGSGGGGSNGSPPQNDTNAGGENAP